jgi:hypothetical protein
MHAVLENNIYGFVREGVPPRVTLACACSIVAFVIVLPLVLAQTPKFSEAAQVCSDRRTQIDPAAKIGAKDVYFVHTSNCLSMLASLCFNWSLFLAFCSLHRTGPHKMLLSTLLLFLL